MSDADSAARSGEQPPRPQRMDFAPLPAIPDVHDKNADGASVEYSHYRTGLSLHRTGLSEHRTDLSEFRTDLSQHRTDLSENRTQMSMRRTGMSFQRTRMSADRTLMSFIRTALSLIGFGFTIYQTFHKLQEAGVIHSVAAPRNFGLALILLGVLLLVGGVVGHSRYMLELRGVRGEMRLTGLIFGETRYPISIVLITALILLLIGIAAAVSIAVDAI